MFCKHQQDFDPIILSVENHATAVNKYRMVDIFFKYLGNYIYTIETEQEIKIKTLAELRNKVIVKTSSRIKNIIDLRRKTSEQEPSLSTVNFHMRPPPKEFPSD